MAFIYLLSFALLTQLGGYDGDVVPGQGLPVQHLVGRDGSFRRIDVEVAVQVTPPVDRVPGRQTKLFFFFQAIITMSKRSSGMLISSRHYKSRNGLRTLWATLSM